ncbi:hypothetical protein [Actinophytocola sediminis]
MRVTYTGPFDGVEIAALGVVVERGKSVEVDDDIGVTLLDQAGWDAEPAVIAAWVGHDPERAARLLTAEKNGAQRADLIARLELIVDPPTDLDVPPTGTAEEVLAWVDTDPSTVVARANRALMAELSGKNRSTLIAQLERLSTNGGE